MRYYGKFNGYNHTPLQLGDSSGTFKDFIENRLNDNDNLGEIMIATYGENGSEYYCLYTTGIKTAKWDESKGTWGELFNYKGYYWIQARCVDVYDEDGKEIPRTEDFKKYWNGLFNIVNWKILGDAQGYKSKLDPKDEGIFDTITNLLKKYWWILLILLFRKPLLDIYRKIKRK
jgi:hypothetical protein